MGVVIIKNSILNIKTLKKLDQGFVYLENIGISYQVCDSNKAITEITNQCIKNNFKLFMKIKLENNNIITISF